jgi:hypothetical protein
MTAIEPAHIDPREHPGRWRYCCWPDCDERYDAIAVAEGREDPAGWVHKVLSLYYLCPAHSASEHVPQRAGRSVVCGCGWVSAERRTLGAMLASWRSHVVHDASPLTCGGGQGMTTATDSPTEPTRLAQAAVTWTEACHEVAWHALTVDATLHAWPVARAFGLTAAQTDQVVEAALAGFRMLVGKWAAEVAEPDGASPLNTEETNQP